MDQMQSIKIGAAIVSTPLVQVIKQKDGFQMLIKAMDGNVIEHEPFPPNLQGMVAAISLSAEICAGKFFLRGLAVKPKPEKEAQRQIGNLG